jgi:hypothetical protein
MVALMVVVINSYRKHSRNFGHFMRFNVLLPMLIGGLRAMNLIVKGCTFLLQRVNGSKNLPRNASGILNSGHSTNVNKSRAVHEGKPWQ